MPKIIVQADGPLLLEDRSMPVIVTPKKGNEVFFWKDISGAATFTGVAQQEIPSLAEVGGERDGFVFTLPTLKELRVRFPTYDVEKQKKQPGPQAVPCLVTCKPVPGSRLPAKIYYRTITSCCAAWNMPKDIFDKITNQHLGWQSLLPGVMTSIRTNVKLPKNYPIEGERTDSLFSLKGKGGSGAVTVDASKVHGKTYPGVAHVPAIILSHSDYVNPKTKAKAPSPEERKK